MKRFRKILAFVRGPKSAVALQRAISLAEENQAELLAMDVLRPPSSLFHPFSRDESVDGLQQDVVRQREEELGKILADRCADRLAVKAKVTVGTPFIEIIHEVLREGYDLVVKSADGRSLLSQRLFGGTAFHLMRQCPCPVWILKPEHDGQLKRILAAVDVAVDADTQQHLRLNTDILTIAQSLADMEGAELHVAHAWSMWAENILKSRVPADEFNSMLEEQEQATSQALAELLKHFDIDPLSPQVRLVKGDPDYVIPELVHADQIELLVMGTVCRTGVPGFVIGNTAEQVLSDVDCSVLTLKPDGFQSPVTLPK